MWLGLRLLVVVGLCLHFQVLSHAKHLKMSSLKLFSCKFFYTSNILHLKVFYFETN